MLRSLPRMASQACRQHLPLTIQQVLPEKHKKQGTRSNTKPQPVAPGNAASPLWPPAKSPPAPGASISSRVKETWSTHSAETWSTGFGRTVHASSQATGRNQLGKGISQEGQTCRMSSWSRARGERCSSRQQDPPRPAGLSSYRCRNSCT